MLLSSERNVKNYKAMILLLSLKVKYFSRCNSSQKNTFLNLYLCTTPLMVYIYLLAFLKKKIFYIMKRYEFLIAFVRVFKSLDITFLMIVNFYLLTEDNMNISQ
jgi:hypothetical protein